MLHYRSLKLQFLLHFLATAAEACDYFKYSTVAGCVRCPVCPIGEEVTKNCGNNGQSGPKCKPCTKGYTFSAKPSVECQQCQLCYGGKRVLKECTLTSDTVCVDQCPDGYVDSNEACIKKPTTMATTEAVTTLPLLNTAASPSVSSQWDGAKSLPSSSLPTRVSLSIFSKLGNVSPSAAAKHDKTEKFITPNASLMMNSTKTNLSVKDLYILISVASFLALLLGFIITVYFCKKRKKMCQSQVCKSQYSTSKKEDAELVEVHVVETFPPQQSHLVAATPIDENDGTPNPGVEAYPGGSTYDSKPFGKSEVNDSGKEPEDIKKSVKDNDPLASHQSKENKANAVQYFESSEPHQNEKLAKENLNKFLDNQIIHRDLNLPREETNIKERGSSTICKRHLKELDLNQHCKVETSTKEPISFIPPSNRTIAATPIDENDGTPNPRVEVQKKCPYRPINRKRHSHCENCLECCPQDSDLLSIIIGRYCLKDEVCTMLNTTNNDSWKKLLTVMRQDKMIAQLQNSREQNPALVAIDKLLVSRPTLSFGAFKSMMNEIERPDIGHIMEHHHFNCDACRRNIFDEPKLCVCQLT